ncbi:hypothetical protein NQ318_013212 [Aromia moschata]|uniref:Uncharacterized protein n=1 Tax=Aromia moschata TaxID=1265417 RepID=A0AAV8XGL8_9CUCU|nr:hypothetical protein NQ318_013212 [Aromia moschata]
MCIAIFANTFHHFLCSLERTLKPHMINCASPGSKGTVHPSNRPQAVDEGNMSYSTDQSTSPEEIRPHVKCQNRVSIQNKRTKKQSTVLTDTPNMEERRKREEEKMETRTVKRKIVEESTTPSSLEEIVDDDSLDERTDSEDEENIRPNQEHLISYSSNIHLRKVLENRNTT